MTMNTELGLENEYLGITEAAEYLRVSASTLRRWEKKGFLVPERTPTGIRRYTKKQLDDVIQAPQLEHNVTQHSEPVVDQTMTNNEGYLDQSTSNHLVENQYAQASHISDDLSIAEVPEEFSLNEIAPAQDAEINELRDFFKKAGYDTSTPTEQSRINSELEWPVTTSAVSEMPNLPQQASVTVELERNAVPKQDAVTENTNTVATVETAQTSPQIESFWKQVHAPAQERIEVFHEESSVNTVRTAHNEDLSSEPRSYRTDLNSETVTQEDHPKNSQHYAETSNNSGNSKKAYMRIAMIGLSIFVVAFIAWAAYSYYSAPVDLYSPVIE
jgi:MerR family regulatory protein